MTKVGEGEGGRGGEKEGGVEVGVMVGGGRGCGGGWRVGDGKRVGATWG